MIASICRTFYCLPKPVFSIVLGYTQTVNPKELKIKEMHNTKRIPEGLWHRAPWYAFLEGLER